MKKILFLIMIVVLATTVSAATLKGSIFDTSLQLEKDVLIEVDQQKFLSKDGSYQFTLDEGTYELTALKGLTEIKEDVIVKATHSKYKLKIWK